MRIRRLLLKYLDWAQRIDRRVIGLTDARADLERMHRAIESFLAEHAPEPPAATSSVSQ